MSQKLLAKVQVYKQNNQTKFITDRKANKVQGQQVHNYGRWAGWTTWAQPLYSSAPGY